MSNMTTVKKDAHGLYARGGGYIFRPYESKWHGYHPKAANNGCYHDDKLKVKPSQEVWNPIQRM